MTDKNGALPKDWKWVKLRDICIQDRQTVNPNSSLASQLLYISLEHIESNTGRILREPSDNIEDEGLSNTFLFNEKHVLYGKLRPYLNKVALPNFSGRCTTEAIPLLPNENVNRDYLAWILRRKETVEAAMRDKTGSRMPRANMDDLLSLEIPLPPLPEQKRILAILNEQMSAVEKARTAAEAQLQAAKTLPAAYLREVFDSPEAQKWERKKLGEVCNKITDGTHQSPLFTSKGIPFIFVRNIVSGAIDFNITNFVSEETYTELTKRCRPEYGDLLYSAVGSFGVAVVIETSQPFTFQRHIALLKPKKNEVYSPFLAFYINSPKGMKQSDEFAFGGGQRTVTLKSLSSFEVPIPSLDEQKHIHSLLSSKIKETQQLQRSLQDQLNTIKQLPAALLRQAFNGEL